MGTEILHLYLQFPRSFFQTCDPICQGKYEVKCCGGDSHVQRSHRLSALLYGGIRRWRFAIPRGSAALFWIVMTAFLDERQNRGGPLSHIPGKMKKDISRGPMYDMKSLKSKWLAGYCDRSVLSSLEQEVSQ